MALDHYFSEKDPQVLEAVEKQYLYGRTKDVLQNIEKDILTIVKEVMRAHRLEIEYPDHVSTLQLIAVALTGLRERPFSEDEMKLLNVFKRKISAAMNQLLDVFEAHESPYGRAASGLHNALYSLNPPDLKEHDFSTDEHKISMKVIEGVLGAMDAVDSTVGTVASKFKRKRDDNTRDSQ
ncbi:MAG: hypothetical protein NTX63_04290 [Candidatus Peregrinibacteria bacterium]|nr:hypothetical protein [Candidatus Peregrinibacteria bacterium]